MAALPKDPPFSNFSWGQTRKVYAGGNPILVLKYFNFFLIFLPNLLSSENLIALLWNGFLQQSLVKQGLKIF